MADTDPAKPRDVRQAYPMTGADLGSGTDAALVRAVAEGSHDALAALNLNIYKFSSDEYARIPSKTAVP